MKKLIKLLLWLAGLAVIAISVTVYFVASLDPNEHKDWIAAKVLQETGRTLSLDGDIDITLYPWLGLEASEVSIGNAEGFGSAPFAYLDYVKLRVKSIPLLRNLYEVDTVNIKGAVINLARNRQGVANWDDFIDEHERKSETPVLLLASTVLGGVAIEDARVTWDDQQAGVRYDVTELDATTAELKYGEPVDIDLSFHGTSNRPAVAATVRLAGIINYATDGRRYAIAPLDVNALITGKNVPGGKTSATLSAAVDVNLDDATATVSDMEITALGASIRGNLSAQEIESPTPAIAASLDAQGSDLGLLFKVAEIEPLASQLGGLTDRSFRISTTMNADLKRGDIDLSKLSANLLGADITGEAMARNVHSDTPSVTGQIEVLPVNLRKLARQLKQELPVTADRDAFTRVALAGRFDGSATDLDLKELNFQLDDSRLTGEFRVSEMATTPALQFDLSVDEINLDRYRAPEPNGRKKPGAEQAGLPAEGGRMVVPVGIPADTMRTLTMEGDVTIGRLVVSNATLSGIKLHLNAQDGVVKADPVSAALYEGRLSGNASLDVNSDSPRLTLNSDLTGIQAEPLLKDITGKARLRGKGNFTAALSATGNTGQSMKRSLNGRMSMSLTEGAVTGLNLGRTLRQWKRFKKGGTIDFKETAATDFSLLSGNPIAKNGVIRMDDLDLKAPAFRLKGKGVLADLHTDTINYQALAAVVNTSKGVGGKELDELVGLELPLNIKGPLDNPKIALAWEDILGSVLTEKILDIIDLSLPGKDNPDKEKETDERPDLDQVKELLKEGLKGIFKR